MGLAPHRVKARHPAPEVQLMSPLVQPQPQTNVFRWCRNTEPPLRIRQRPHARSHRPPRRQSCCHIPPQDTLQWSRLHKHTPRTPRKPYRAPHMRPTDSGLLRPGRGQVSNDQVWLLRAECIWRRIVSNNILSHSSRRDFETSSRRSLCASPPSTTSERYKPHARRRPTSREKRSLDDTPHAGNKRKIASINSR